MIYYCTYLLADCLQKVFPLLLELFLYFVHLGLGLLSEGKKKSQERLELKYSSVRTHI
jgi:hypothetical protein